MATVRVGIHQPNFLPWAGYFDKIKKSDVFVFLDDVQVIKTGSSWFNRVRIRSQKTEDGQWLTVPTQRPPGVQKIHDVKVVDEQWLDRVISTLRTVYSKHPYLYQTIEYLTSIKSAGPQQLCDWNISVISNLSKEMGISNATFVKSSTLNVNSSGTQRLLDLTRAVGGNTYMCGGGSSDYFQPEILEDAGINVQFQNFVPEPYSQLGSPEFVPGLSIVDYLINSGW